MKLKHALVALTTVGWAISGHAAEQYSGDINDLKAAAAALDKTLRIKDEESYQKQAKQTITSINEIVQKLEARPSATQLAGKAVDPLSHQKGENTSIETEWEHLQNSFPDWMKEYVSLVDNEKSIYVNIMTYGTESDYAKLMYKYLGIKRKINGKEPLNQNDIDEIKEILNKEDVKKHTPSSSYLQYKKIKDSLHITQGDYKKIPKLGSDLVLVYNSLINNNELKATKQGEALARSLKTFRTGGSYVSPKY